jgi:hypothetical protein
MYVVEAWLVRHRARGQPQHPLIALYLIYNTDLQVGDYPFSGGPLPVRRQIIVLLNSCSSYLQVLIEAESRKPRQQSPSPHLVGYSTGWAPSFHLTLIKTSAIIHPSNRTLSHALTPTVPRWSYSRSRVRPTEPHRDLIPWPHMIS